MFLSGSIRQLRPKVDHYHLTVENGHGYNLNLSLFERLILKGYPREVLGKQRRMRPEISSLIRHLTYPNLVDDDTTLNRADLRGVRDNVIFVTHGHPEDEVVHGIVDVRDGRPKTSKQNSYEVQMALKVVKYLVQQGYDIKDIVVLTPYLGQLHKLQQAFQNDTDPYLNDMDMRDLVQAGLALPVPSTAAKKRLQLATIGASVIIYSVVSNR